MNLNTDRLRAMLAMSNLSNDDPIRPTELRDVADAIRFVYSLMTKLPLPPLVAAFIVSLTLGTIPAATTIACSLFRELVHFCRSIGHSRYAGARDSDQAKPSYAQGPLSGPSISDGPIVTNSLKSLEHMEPL